MRRVVVSIALAVSLSALGASSALAQAPEGAQKSPLFGPQNLTDEALCGGGTMTAKTFGFVILNTPTEPTLTGEVVLKGATPNTTYNVADIQSNGTTDCSGTFRGSQIHTNGQGNGTVKFSVQRDPEFTEFYVAVDTERFNGNPPFVLEHAFISRLVELD